MKAEPEAAAVSQMETGAALNAAPAPLYRDGTDLKDEVLCR
jgi:hypothetical protein